ncbi:MAG: minor capsid protein [Leptospira sp.]|nr:minor capsid protein [Leptospira sp.]
MNFIMYPVKGNVEKFIMIMPIQGKRSKYYTDSAINLSIVIQDTNDRKGLENAMLIYDLYRDQTNKTIPLDPGYKAEITEGRSIIANFIQAVDHPVTLGDQGNGRYQYSLNFLIQLKETT